MNRKILRKAALRCALLLLLATVIPLQSCIGSFALTKKVLAWNRKVDNKFVNELVFFSFWILPVYELCGLADLLVINSIEFWSGSNPAATTGKPVKPIKEQPIDITSDNANHYRIMRDATGYTITDRTDGTSVRLAFDADDNSWWLHGSHGEAPRLLFRWCDENHILLPQPGGGQVRVRTDYSGVLAYRALIEKQGALYALR